jgi:hypothetical protein
VSMLSATPAALTQQGMVVGTFQYMAPELLTESPDFDYTPGHPRTEVKVPVMFPGSADIKDLPGRAFKAHTKFSTDTKFPERLQWTVPLLREMMAGDRYIAVSGIVTYDDVFGSTGRISAHIVFIQASTVARFKMLLGLRSASLITQLIPDSPSYRTMARCVLTCIVVRKLTYPWVRTAEVIPGSSSINFLVVRGRFSRHLKEFIL